jgi:hypothetical protein
VPGIDDAHLVIAADALAALRKALAMFRLNELHAWSTLAMRGVALGDAK